MICSILVTANAKHAEVASDLARELSENGHGVTFSVDYDEVANALELPFDATVIVGGMDDRDGMRLPISSAVKRLAARGAGQIIALTEGTTTFGRAAVLEAGARKCLEIGDATAEDLSAVIGAWERRRRGLTTTVIEVGDLHIDTMDHTVTRAGNPVALSARAYAILERAIAVNGEPLDRQSLRRIIGLPIFQTGGARVMAAEIVALQAAVGRGLVFNVGGLRYVPEAADSETRKTKVRKPKAVAVAVEVLEVNVVPTLATIEQPCTVVEAITEITAPEIDAIAAVEEQFADIAPVAEQPVPEVPAAEPAEQEVTLFAFIPLAEVRKPQKQVAPEATKPKAPARKRTEPEPIPIPPHGVVLPFRRRPGKESCRSRPEIPGQGWLFGREPPPSRKKSPQQLAKAA